MDLPSFFLITPDDLGFFLGEGSPDTTSGGNMQLPSSACLIYGKDGDYLRRHR